MNRHQDPSTERFAGIAPDAERRSLRLMAVLATLMGFASISTDLYLPALPSMAGALHAGHGTMEFTITGYLIGFSLGQLLWGPIGDRFGRRLPVAFGLILFVIGSAGCALSTGAAEMIGWRVVQAVGACSGVVLSRAMVRDLFDRDRAAQMLSTLILVMAVAPLVGPLVGGQILAFGSWRMIFWLLVVIGAGTTIALFTIPETLAPERRDREAVTRALHRYIELVRDRRVLGYAGIGGCFYVGVYAYIAGSPFAYISYYHVPTQLYGFLFGGAIAGIMITNLLNTRLVVRFGSDRLLRVGAAGAAVSGALVGVSAALGWGGLAGLVLPLLLFAAMSGLIVANSIAGALSAHPERAGAASALVGAVHYGCGIVGSALVGALADGTPWPLGGIVAVSGVGSLACTMFLVRSGKKAALG